MIDPKKINIENPIFVFYIDVRGKGRNRAEEEVAEMMRIFNYGEITSWFIQIQTDSRVEVIWKGKSVEKSNISNNRMNMFMKTFEDILEMMSDGSSSGDIQQKIRSMQLDYILN